MEYYGDAQDYAENPTSGFGGDGGDFEQSTWQLPQQLHHAVHPTQLSVPSGNSGYTDIATQAQSAYTGYSAWGTVRDGSYLQHSRPAALVDSTWNPDTMPVASSYQHISPSFTGSVSVRELRARSGSSSIPPTHDAKPKNGTRSSKTKRSKEEARQANNEASQRFRTNEKARNNATLDENERLKEKNKSLKKENETLRTALAAFDPDHQALTSTTVAVTSDSDNTQPEPTHSRKRAKTQNNRRKKPQLSHTEMQSGSRNTTVADPVPSELTAYPSVSEPANSEVPSEYVFSEP
ncbi:hypothetical protein IAT40_002793 [Kwoniella sp. CBS 6097]